MLRTVCIVTVTLICAQAHAQGTPQGATESPPVPATPSAASAKEFPKSAAVLPTGKTENQWGPFEGRVVDAESGEAIAGAAVIVFWKKAVLNPVEEHLEFYDARWAVTNTDGRFTVPRRGPPLITLGIGGAFLSCVAPGYLPYEFTPGYNWRVESSRLRPRTSSRSGTASRLPAIPRSRAASHSREGFEDVWSKRRARATRSA